MSGLGSKLSWPLDHKPQLLTYRIDALSGVGDTVGKTTQGVTDTVGGAGELFSSPLPPYLSAFETCDASYWLPPFQHW